METKIIYFVHGTTYDNASGKCSGWKQVEPNDLGKQQAVNLGNLNKDLKADVIDFCQETADKLNVYGRFSRSIGVVSEMLKISDGAKDCG